MKKHLFFLILISIIKIQAQDQSNPNILFIAIDDLKPTLGIYGDSFAVTPNIDAIAKINKLEKRKMSELNNN